jgi:hypothetical protein
MQLRELPLAQQSARPRRLLKSRSLAPETPRRVKISSFTDQPLCICVTVIVEYNQIRYACRLSCPQHLISGSIQLNRCMSNLRRLPVAIWITTAQVRDLKFALPSRLDLIE